MRSLLFLFLLSSFLLSSSFSTEVLREWTEASVKDPSPKVNRYRTFDPYTLCPVGSLKDWRSKRIASLAHVTVSNVSRENEKQMPKEYDEPFSTIEYGRTCVMTLGFTARDSRPILAYVGTAIPRLLETTITGFYRLTRNPRRDPLSGQIPDMALFYSKDKTSIGNCDLYKNAQHITYTSPAGYYFVVCYGPFERLLNEQTKGNIRKAGSIIYGEYAKGEESIEGRKWSYKNVTLAFLDPSIHQKRFRKALSHSDDNNEFVGWSETVMPHYDMKTVIYESYYKKVRTEANAKHTNRFIISTSFNVLQCILMEKFYLLLRKYLL